MTEPAFASDRNRGTAAAAASGLTRRVMLGNEASRNEGTHMSYPLPPQVQAYVDAIPAEYRALFGRLHRLILRAHPGAEVTLSYKMPAYRAGQRRMYLGVWQHGISVYGWKGDRDEGFTSRHPELVTGKGTIQLRPDDAAAIHDEEFLALARSALAP